jgi:hypothetical protein
VPLILVGGRQPAHGFQLEQDPHPRAGVRCAVFFDAVEIPLRRQNSDVRVALTFRFGCGELPLQLYF